MGSRTAEKLTEIAELRSDLERKLVRLEEQVPMAGWGRQVAAALGMLIPVIAFVLRTMRERAERSRAKETEAEAKVQAKMAKASAKAERRAGRRAARRAAKAAPEPEPVAPAEPVVVNVVPKGAVAVGAAAVAVWAGFKVFEMLQDKRSN